MGVGPRTVTARSTRSKDAQERDPVALALNCTPPQTPTPTPVLFAPNVISPPELPSARKVPRTYRWTLGSARTVVPGVGWLCPGSSDDILDEGPGYRA